MGLILSGKEIDVGVEQVEGGLLLEVQDEVPDVDLVRYDVLADVLAVVFKEIQIGAEFEHTGEMPVGFELAFETRGVRERDAGGVVLVGFGGAEDARGLDLRGFDRGDRVFVGLGDHFRGVLLRAHDVLERPGDIEFRVGVVDGRRVMMSSLVNIL